MKAYLGLAALAGAAIIAAAPTGAEAQSVGFRVRLPNAPSIGYRKDWHPYAPSQHAICQRKAWRLHWFDQNARADGFYSRWERQERRALVADLDRTCGRFRWRG